MRPTYFVDYLFHVPCYRTLPLLPPASERELTWQGDDILSILLEFKPTPRIGSDQIRLKPNELW